jgi:hypothetical protein
VITGIAIAIHAHVVLDGALLWDRFEIAVRMRLPSINVLAQFANELHESLFELDYEPLQRDNQLGPYQSRAIARARLRHHYAHRLVDLS